MKIEILGIKFDDLSVSGAVELISSKIADGVKYWITTPNPEFLVASQRDEKFKRLLQEADLSLPDGIGLVVVPRLLGVKPSLSSRVAGADVVRELLEAATKRGWRIGIVGARKGKMDEVSKLIEKLRDKYEGLAIESLDDQPGWIKRDYDLIFACHGMGDQEEWIFENLNKSRGNVFMSVGGSLDFLSGFSVRAPFLVRNLGLEWLWRLVTRPTTHWSRVYRAFVVFPFLLLKERLSLFFLNSK